MCAAHKTITESEEEVDATSILTTFAVTLLQMKKLNIIRHDMEEKEEE